MPLSLDEALALLVDELRAAPVLSPHYDPIPRTKSFGCDIRLSDVLRKWWFKEHGAKHPVPDPSQIDYAPFQDAAWELARRGIMRPGPVLPVTTMGGHQNTEADGFSLTNAGRDWILNYDQQGPFPVDPGRFSLLINQYADRLGPAFAQRITEAAGCYRSMNYFAACAMAGAACESILIALAVEKMKDEAKVLRIYLGRDGRRLLINSITDGIKPSLKQAIQTATNILSYWRDTAAHGYATEISEFAAHDALSRLLRFTQFVDANWQELTVV